MKDSPSHDNNDICMRILYKRIIVFTISSQHYFKVFNIQSNKTYGLRFEF